MGGAVSIKQKDNIDDNIITISSEKVVETCPEIDTIFNYYETIYDIGDSIVTD